MWRNTCIFQKKALKAHKKYIHFFLSKIIVLWWHDQNHLQFACCMVVFKHFPTQRMLQGFEITWDSLGRYVKFFALLLELVLELLFQLLLRLFFSFYLNFYLGFFVSIICKEVSGQRTTGKWISSNSSLKYVKKSQSYFHWWIHSVLLQNFYLMLSWNPLPYFQHVFCWNLRVLACGARKKPHIFASINWSHASFSRRFVPCIHDKILALQYQLT